MLRYVSDDEDEMVQNGENVSDIVVHGKVAGGATVASLTVVVADQSSMRDACL